MRRRWLCRLCSTTDDGYAGCAEGIEPSNAMTTMTCLFVLACFCLPLSVEPFLCPLVCSSCFAHLLLRASDVPAPQMSKSPLSLLAGYRLSRTWRPCAAAYQSCLYSSMLCLQTYAHTHAHIYTHKSTHFILDSHHPAMLGDGDTRQTHSRTHSTLDSHHPAMLGDGDTRRPRPRPPRRRRGK